MNDRSAIRREFWEHTLAGIDWLNKQQAAMKPKPQPKRFQATPMSYDDYIVGRELRQERPDLSEVRDAIERRGW